MQTYPATVTFRGGRGFKNASGKLLDLTIPAIRELFADVAVTIKVAGLDANRFIDLAFRKRREFRVVFKFIDTDGDRTDWDSNAVVRRASWIRNRRQTVADVILLADFSNELP